MPNEIPGFLQDFMSHRAHLSKKDMTSPAQKKSDSLKPVKGRAEIDMAIDGIIEKKPKNKIVKEFFQNRCDEMSKAKMN
jgi:hypothetical protein